MTISKLEYLVVVVRIAPDAVDAVVVLPTLPPTAPTPSAFDWMKYATTFSSSTMPEDDGHNVFSKDGDPAGDKVVEVLPEFVAEGAMVKIPPAAGG